MEILNSIENGQDGWLEAFNTIADAEVKEASSFLELKNQFDEEDWTW